MIPAGKYFIWIHRLRPEMGVGAGVYPEGKLFSRKNN